MDRMILTSFRPVTNCHTILDPSIPTYFMDGPNVVGALV